MGINTAIYSQSGGYQGIGFAVPSNLARKVMDDLVRYGEVRRGYLGYFETIPLTADIAAELGVSRTRGIGRQPDGSHQRSVWRRHATGRRHPDPRVRHD